MNTKTLIAIGTKVTVTTRGGKESPGTVIRHGLDESFVLIETKNRAGNEVRRWYRADGVKIGG